MYNVKDLRGKEVIPTVQHKLSCYACNDFIMKTKISFISEIWKYSLSGGFSQFAAGYNDEIVIKLQDPREIHRSHPGVSQIQYRENQPYQPMQFLSILSHCRRSRMALILGTHVPLKRQNTAPPTVVKNSNHPPPIQGRGWGGGGACHIW
jgi:hypothetical protein